MTLHDVKPRPADRDGASGDGGWKPRATLAAVLLAAAGGTVAVLAGLTGESVAYERVVHLPAPPPRVAVIDTMARGQTLAQLLGEHGISGRRRYRFIRSVREYERPRYLQPGVRLKVVRDPRTERIEETVLELGPDRRLHLLPADTSWRARLDSVPVRRDTIVVAGLVHSSLWEAELRGDTAALAPGESWDVIGEVTRIFQWQVDFYRELRTGDAFRVAVAREVRPDGTIRSARVLGAELRNAGEQMWAVNFDARTPTADGYYDLEGQSLETRFLRAPLEYSRVTSGFTRSRYHPVLRRRRAHLGIDYGAAPGTPVRATGRGTVTRAGWWGGYGRIVEVRHSGSYRTRYAHLRRIAPGLSVGDRVEQGAVVGRVGSSGLASGPHLHYEFLERGGQVDPADLELPPGDPVPDSEEERFERQRDMAVRHLMRVPMPRPERLAREKAAP